MMNIAETIDYSALVTTPFALYFLWCYSLGKDWVYILDWYMWLWGVVMALLSIRIALSVISIVRTKKSIRRRSKRFTVENYSFREYVKRNKI